MRGASQNFSASLTRRAEKLCFSGEVDLVPAAMPPLREAEEGGAAAGNLERLVGKAELVRSAKYLHKARTEYGRYAEHLDDRNLSLSLLPREGGMSEERRKTSDSFGSGQMAGRERKHCIKFSKNQLHRHR